ADAHPAAAADDGHVGGDGAVDERAALLDDRALRVEAQVMVEVNGARGDFHTPYATIAGRAPARTPTINAELAELAERPFGSACSACSALHVRGQPGRRSIRLHAPGPLQLPGSPPSARRDRRDARRPHLRRRPRSERRTARTPAR